jgi:hypothetical protein
MWRKDASGGPAVALLLCAWRYCFPLALLKPQQRERESAA